MCKKSTHCTMKNEQNALTCKLNPVLCHVNLTVEDELRNDIALFT